MPSIKFLTEFEEAKGRAIGLMDVLSEAYAGARHSLGRREAKEIDYGVSMAMSDLQTIVANQWKELEQEWTAQRDLNPAGLELGRMPQILRNAFGDLVSPLRTAAACVHCLTLALAQHAEGQGLFHHSGAVKGYEELANYWPSEILKPCSAWDRASRNTRPASEPKVAA
jgi:hypothetical protein